MGKPSKKLVTGGKHPRKVKTHSKKQFKSKHSPGKKKSISSKPKADSKKKSHLDSGAESSEGKKRKFSSEEGEGKPDQTDSNKSQKKGPLDRKAQKELSELRKKKRKPYFELEKEVVVLWEKMRQRDLPSEERSRLVSKTLTKMKGKILQMAMSHTCSRVLQSCIKHCQEAERSEVFQELRPRFLDLALNSYACHLAQRMLDHAKKDQLQQMISVFHGSVVRLLRHPSGSAVIEHAYQLANGSQRQELVSEFFSPEYRLFRNISSGGRGRLVDILSKEPASKRKSVLEHMTLAIQPILEKGIVDHSIIHRALVEYLSICPPKMVRGVVEQLSGPLIVRMIHTLDGAKLGVLCVRNGSPKERKKIVKALKGQAMKVAQDDHGYAVLLSIFEVVDDTELVNKIVMTELSKGIKDLASNKYGHRIILHLLAPHVSRYFPAELLKTLKCPIESFSGLSKSDTKNEDELEPKDGEAEPKDTTTGSEDDAEAEDSTTGNEDEEAEDAATENEDDDDTENDGEAMGVSKKDPLVRRTELLQKTEFAKKLVEICAADAGELLRSPVGKDVIYEVARGGVDGILLKFTEEGISSVHKAIADLAALPKDEQSGEHVLEHYHASRTIRRLVLDGNCQTKGKSFAERLWHIALKGKAKTWAQGHSAKVVTAFRDSQEPAVKRFAKSEIDSLIASGLLESPKASTAAAAK